MIYSCNYAPYIVRDAVCNCGAGNQAGVHGTGCPYPVTTNVVGEHGVMIRPTQTRTKPPPAWLKRVWRRYRLRF